MRLQQDTWCSKELISVKLGDKKLNKRLFKVASDLLNHPTEPIHAACGSWQAAKAAYRLFDNDKLQETVLLQAHQMETVKRLAKSEEILLAIQDTTTLNYTHDPKKKGINKINQNVGFAKPTRGFFLHNTLLMTEKGLPLGLLDQKIFQHPTGEKIDHKRRPIEEKQSFRWLESLKTTKSLCPEKTVVTVADRESDIFELFVEAEEIKANILIRAAKDRKLTIDGQSNQTLWVYMRKILVGGIQTVKLPAHHNLLERSANLEVRYAKIILNPPKRYPGAKGKLLSPVNMQAVWLYETSAPSGIEPLEWMLLTNMPVDFLEDAVRMSKWYQLRWQIECYHRILKSGCKVEEYRLETYECLKKYIRLKSIIAFRLFLLTIVGRIHPKLSSDQILEEHEWKALCCHITKNRNTPTKAPSLRDAIRLIAKLGGFLGRKHDKEPGMIYIWRGWEKLTLIADFWLSTCSEMTCG